MTVDPYAMTAASAHHHKFCPRQKHKVHDSHNLPKFNNARLLPLLVKTVLGIAILTQRPTHIEQFLHLY